METIIKIKNIELKKFNNPEYVNFMTRFRSLIPLTFEKDNTPNVPIAFLSGNVLGIMKEQLTAFDADLAVLNDLVNQSRISNETAEMIKLDQERSELLVYTTSFVSKTTKSPLRPQQVAAQAVYNIVKPYIGIYKSPNQQKTANIRGLMTDLEKPDMREAITTLGLLEVVASLRTTNERYATLTTQRTNNKAASMKENSASIRLRMDALYDQMTTNAFVRSVSSPSKETATFVNRLNAMIDEVIALHRQRRASAKKPKKEDTPEATEL